MNKAKPTLMYCVSQGLFWASFAAISAFASVFLLAKGFTNTQIGFVLSGGCAASALIQPVLGKRADRSRKCIIHKNIIAISFFIIILAGLLLVPGKGFWVTAFIYGMYMMSLHTLTPFVNSLGMYYIGKGVPVNFGIARGIGSIAYAALSAGLGYLVSSFDERVTIYSVLILYSVMIVSTFRFHFNGVSEENAVAESSKEKRVKGFLLSHKRFAGVCIGVVLLFICHNLLNIYMFQIVSYHGFGSKEMGMCQSISAAVELPILFCYSLVNRKLRSGTLLKISGVFFTMKPLILLLATNLGTIYGAMCVQLLGYGLFAGTSVYYVNHTIEEESRVQGQTYMTVTNTLGAVIGILSGGLLIDRISVPGLLTTALSCAATGALVILLFAENGKTS